MTDNPRMQVPDVTAQERINQIEASVAIQLDGKLAAVRDRIAGAFPSCEFSGFRGELTVTAPPDVLVDLLTFCKTDPDLSCELLSDVTGVHWPGGVHEHQGQETTGWPTYTIEQAGRIDVLYILRSVSRNHWFRVKVSLPDEHAAVPSAVPVYRSANVLEREVFDLMGVRFEGHPRLERLFMPEDWEGHPLRKDYPLGGVEVQYKGATVPPPSERQY
ncbi:MAG TPA: NADH-quinone oxidoreductase subunit C [Egibacteraceae bacterium]|nr:NADH-quinone oxidoreductase subunit C [Egibacteraceae bacterium]